ncbi:hypothetical protein [Scytonema sp. PCC 10023]|uniref:hypothetical protein n=1 Tax=Scytonema sp. PCC 10023 TaxID=1680591 RepID=UPI0039C6BCF1
MHPEVDESSEMIGWVPVRGHRPSTNTGVSIGGLPQLIIAVAAIIGLSAFGSYFFAKNQRSENEIQQAQQRAITAERERFYQCIGGQGGNSQ